MEQTYHTPVLLNEAISSLKLKDGGIYVDATLGGGGHTRAILESGYHLKLIALDQDEDAITNALELEKKYPDLTLIKDNFYNLRTNLALQRIKKIDGILFDLGVSSYQINTPERGFSFSMIGSLDMRMNKDNELTASEVINSFEPAVLKRIFLLYGEEKEASSIVRGIIIERSKKTIDTTNELAFIIEKYTRSPQKIKAKARIFQALRIYLNNEMEVLKTALSDAVKTLNPDGRIVVISYHSLEDRIVKQFFQYEAKDCICPSDFPQCVCDKKSTLKIITKKPVVPTTEEINANPRARSARMRAAQKQEEK
jgi:16S rRNA (cytosine1402-N4)-methyltransferase